MKARGTCSTNRSHPGYSILEYPLLMVIFVIALAIGLPAVQGYFTGLFTSNAKRMSQERFISGDGTATGGVVTVSRSITAIRQMRGLASGPGADQIPANLVEVSKPLNNADVTAQMGKVGAGGAVGAAALNGLLGDTVPTVRGAISQQYVTQGAVAATVPTQKDVTVPVGKILDN